MPCGSRFATFNAEGAATALATIATLTTLSLVLPTFTTSTPGPEFSPAQLAFAALASITLYGLFVIVQTVRHRDQFVPLTDDGMVDDHQRPTDRQAVIALGFLLVALVAVVGLAKIESPAIEGIVEAIGAPHRPSAWSSPCWCCSPRRWPPSGMRGAIGSRRR